MRRREWRATSLGPQLGPATVPEVGQRLEGELRGLQVALHEVEAAAALEAAELGLAQRVRQQVAAAVGTAEFRLHETYRTSSTSRTSGRRRCERTDWPRRSSRRWAAPLVRGRASTRAGVVHGL